MISSLREEESLVRQIFSQMTLCLKIHLLLCMSASPACMHVYHMCVWCKEKNQRTCPQNGLTDSYELPHGYWKLN